MPAVLWLRYVYDKENVNILQHFRRSGASTELFFSTDSILFK